MTLLALACCLTTSCHRHTQNSYLDTTILKDNDIALQLHMPDTSIDAYGMWTITGPYVEDGLIYLSRHGVVDDGDTCREENYILPHKDPRHDTTVESWFSHISMPPRDFDELKEEMRENGGYRDADIKHLDISGMPQDLYVVMTYHGQPYLSTEYCYGIRLTDSIIIYHYMEETIAMLSEVRRLDKDAFELTSLDWNYDSRCFENKTDTLRLIDPQRGLYKLGRWHYTTRNYLKEYNLIVSQSDCWEPGGVEYDW